MNFSTLTVFDWVLLALLVISTARAAVLGFLREACSLVGLIAGILLASWNYAALATKLVDWLRAFTTLSVATADILAFLFIVSLIMVLAGLIGKLLRSSVTAIGLGPVDRLCGAAFGLARGCLLGVACVMVLAAFDPSGRLTLTLVKNSQLLPYFLDGARGVSFVVPGSLQRQLADGADHIKHNRSLWIKPPQ